MPNNVTTICTVTGPVADVATFIERHIRSDGEPSGQCRLDFNTVIARPSILNDIDLPSPPLPDAELGMAALVGDLVWTDFGRYLTPYYSLPQDILTGAPVQHARQVRKWLAANRPGALAAGTRYLAAIVQTGYPTWYEWSIANWGTKWNAYDYEERERLAGRFVFKFETAWSFPEPIFRRLAEAHPTLVLAVISCEESGNFACEGEFNGKNDYLCDRALITSTLRERVYGRETVTNDDEASPWLS